MTLVRCPKCNPPGPVRPVGVVRGHNGATTICPECNGRGWMEEKAK